MSIKNNVFENSIIKKNEQNMKEHQITVLYSDCIGTHLLDISVLLYLFYTMAKSRFLWLTFCRFLHKTAVREFEAAKNKCFLLSVCCKTGIERLSYL